MVRGNWQRRVEQSKARRAAAKLEKELRRKKRSASFGGELGDPKASYRQLEEWLDEKGDGIGVLCDDGYGGATVATVEGTNSSISSITVDIWTDARPRNRPEYIPPAPDDAHGDDYDDEGGRNNKGRSKGKQKDRGGFKKKGKAHPNAKNKASQENESAGRERSGSIHNPNAVKDDRLCGQEFFFGKDECKGTLQFKQQKQKGGRKRSGSVGGEADVGCNLQHYHELPKVKRKQKGMHQSQPMTLAQVLNGKFQPHHVQLRGDDTRPVSSLPHRVREASLKLSFGASMADSNNASVDMVYHARFFVENKAETTSDDIGDKSSDTESDEHASVSSNGEPDDPSSGEDEGSDAQKSTILDTLEQVLEKGKVDTSSIVYLAIQGVLIYDRFRGGITFTTNEERFLLFGDAVDDAIAEYIDENDAEREPMRIHEQLTHHLLDEILSYCDDEGAGILPQVCTSWRDEVGTRSPQLWKMLLGRHGWPMNICGGENGARVETDIIEERDHCHKAFVSHYTVARDVRAISNTCAYMNGESAPAHKDKLEAESAMQVYKARIGAPTLEGLIDPSNPVEVPHCIVKIWSNTKYDACTRARALGAYADYTLRLFEVVQGNSSSSQESKGIIKCRQIVCVRASPPSSSQKKDSCRLLAMDLDDEVVACFFEERREEAICRRGGPDSIDDHIPWMTAISREEIICAGNEGMLDDASIQSYDLRGAILDYLLGGVPDGQYEELRDSLHNHLSLHDGSTDDVHAIVTPKLVSCGMGHFLFHAYVDVPGCSEEGDSSDSFGHRLFLFSTRKGKIVQSLQLERRRESTSLFASRPYRRPASADAPSAVCTNVLVSAPTMPTLLMSVEIKRGGVVESVKKTMIEGDDLAPWSKTQAVLTSTSAVFSTDPLWQGPLLHFQRIDESSTEHFHTVEIPGERIKLRHIFLIRDHYIAVVIANHQDIAEDENEEFDGHWFGDDEDKRTFGMIIYHIPTRQEVCRYPILSETLSMDCVGDTLALNLSHLGFAITGGNARDVARQAINEDNLQIASPSGKNPKGKKKRLASIASGRKKDGFARGMSLRG